MLAWKIFTALVAAVSPEAAAVSPQDVRILSDSESVKCNYNRLLPSADGSNLALWRTEEDLLKPVRLRWPAEFVVASGLEDAFGRGRPRLRTYSLLGRLEPLRWAVDRPRLYGRLGDDGTFHVDLPDSAIEAGPALDERWRNARLTATSYGDLSPLTDARGNRSIAEAFRLGQPLRIAATVDRSARILTLREGDGFRISTIVDGRTRRHWERGIFTRDVALDADALEYLGRQESGKPFLAYARPLFDLDSGKIVGRYGFTKFVTEVEGKSAITDVQTGHDELVLVRHALRARGSTWALLDLQTQMRLVRMRESKIESLQLCRKLDFPSGKYLELDPRLRGMKRSEILFGRPRSARASAMSGHLYRPSNAGNDLSIYLHGGPTGTLAEYNDPRVVSELAGSGRSVLVIEYSGSVGGGYALSDRLPRRGFKALQEDVATLVEWIKGQGYRKVALIGESFGGVPALIAALEHPQTFDDIFFVAPLVRLSEGPVIVTRSQLDRVTGKSQWEWETAVFGGKRGRDKFRAALGTTLDRLPASPKFHFFFGKVDEVSSVSHLPERLLGSGTVASYPRVSHETLGTHPLVWAAIRERLADE